MTRSSRQAERVVRASLPDVHATILDIDAYPTWVSGYRSAAVHEHDADGRVAVAEFSVGGLGISTSYRLRYAHEDDPVVVAFEQIDGELTRTITGRYELTPHDDGTHVLFAAAIELRTGVPRLLRSTAEKLILDHALRGLDQEVRRRTSTT